MCSIFAELPVEELEILSAAKCGQIHPKKTIIFQANQPAPGIYCVNSGKVKIYKMGLDGEEHIVRISGPGDILGYKALITGQPYSNFAATLEETSVCFIPRGTIFGIMARNSNLSQKMLQLLAVELKLSEESTARMAGKTVDERLAETLLLLQEAHGLQADGQTLKIDLTREDLSRIIGANTVSTFRALHKLADKQAISLEKRSIRIIDLQHLITVANVVD